jgi:hypothetical protein
MLKKCDKSMVGKIVKMVAFKGSGSTVPLGTELRITSFQTGSVRPAYNVAYACSPCGNVGWVYADEVSVCIQTVEEMEKTVLELEVEIMELKSKISFVKKFGLENYDDDEYKAYAVLETIGIEDIQKAKAIVKILSK